MALSWLSVDAKSGVVNAYLPNVIPQGKCAVTISAYQSLAFTVPLPVEVVTGKTKTGTPVTKAQQLAQLSDFQAATRAGASVLIALDEGGQPCWGGLILTVTEDTTETVQLSTATMEAYLDRRYAGPFSATETADALVDDLIDQFIANGTLPGIPIRVQQTTSAQVVTRSYAVTDNTSIYAALQELSSLYKGIQWTIGWEWQDAPVRVTPVLYVADRLGSAPGSGVGPQAVFSLPGNVVSAQRVKDYSSQKGANIITEHNPVQGFVPIQLFSPDYLGRPAFEARLQPATTATATDDTLLSQANAAMAAMNDGTTAVTVTAQISKAPVLGVDWFLGDDVGLNLMAPAWLDGSLQNVIGTVAGWQRDDTTISPILLKIRTYVPVIAPTVPPTPPPPPPGVGYGLGPYGVAPYGS